MQTESPKVVNEHGEVIAEHSPEGTPAHPELNSTSIRLMAVLFPIPAIVIAAVVWWLFGAPLALATLGAGLILTLVLNPTLWAIVLRAKERERIEQKDENA